MASVSLGRADLALLADPGSTKIVIPYLIAMSVPWSQDKTFVRFVGDTHSVAFRGEGQDLTFVLSCMFARKNHDELASFLRLLQVVAPAAPDSRLLLRTHVGLAAGLNDAVAVEVDGPVTPTWSAPAVTVALTVRVVEYDPAV